MAEFSRDEPSGHLYLFGGGPLETQIRRRAAQPDLRGRVTIGGWADEAVAVSWLAACDCVVIPSRMESIPVIFSDALQMGRPLIVSDVGDMGSLLREHPAGLVVPAGRRFGAVCRDEANGCARPRSLRSAHSRARRAVRRHEGCRRVDQTSAVGAQPAELSAAAQRWRLFLCIAVLVAFTAWTFGWVYRHASDFRVLADLPGRSVLGLFAIAAATVICNGLYIKFALQAFQVEIPAREWLSLTVATSLLNYVTPLRGGMVARAVYLKAHHRFGYVDFLSTSSAMVSDVRAHVRAARSDG